MCVTNTFDSTDGYSPLSCCPQRQLEETSQHCSVDQGRVELTDTFQAVLSWFAEGNGRRGLRKWVTVLEVQTKDHAIVHQHNSTCSLGLLQ